MSVHLGDAFGEPVELLAGDLVVGRVACPHIGTAQQFEIAVIGFAPTRLGLDQPVVEGFRQAAEFADVVLGGAVEG